MRPLVIALGVLGCLILGLLFGILAGPRVEGLLSGPSPSAPLTGAGGPSLAPAGETEPRARPVAPFASGPAAAPASPIEPPDSRPVVGVSRGLVVTGEGTVRAQPDLAVLTVGVQNQAPTAQKAQARTNAAMTAVIERLKRLGLRDQDLQTSGLGLHPLQERPGQVTGYQAVNTLIVQVADVRQAGAVLDAAVSAGANTAGPVRFGFKDPTALRLQALTAAVAQARQKAEAIARASGVQIRQVEAVVEEESGPQPLFREAVPMAAPAAPIEPGQVALTVRVRVVFAISP